MSKRKRYVGNLERLRASYRYRVMIGGKAHRFTTATTDEAEAIEFAIAKYAELVTEAGTARRRGPVDRLRFSQLVARYESDRLPLLASADGRKSYGHALALAGEYFGDMFGDPLVNEMKSGDVADFLAWPSGVSRPGRQEPDETDRSEDDPEDPVDSLGAVQLRRGDRGGGVQPGDEGQGSEERRPGSRDPIR